MLATQNLSLDSSGSSSLDYSSSSGVDDSGHARLDNLDCPLYSEKDFEFLDTFSFWVEGVLQTILAFFGIVGNTIASVIISRKEMRNSFNLLLVSLACFDSTYRFGSILESFREDAFSEKKNKGRVITTV